MGYKGRNSVSNKELLITSTFNEQQEDMKVNLPPPSAPSQLWGQQHNLLENMSYRGRCTVCYSIFSKQYHRKKAMTIRKQVKTSCLCYNLNFMCLEYLFSHTVILFSSTLGVSFQGVRRKFWPKDSVIVYIAFLLFTSFLIMSPTYLELFIIKRYYQIASNYYNTIIRCTAKNAKYQTDTHGLLIGLIEQIALIRPRISIWYIHHFGFCST